MYFDNLHKLDMHIYIIVKQSYRYNLLIFTSNTYFIIFMLHM